MSDMDSVRQAMEGMTAAYFVYQLIPGLIDATAYFAQAAREAVLRSIVNMSQISSRPELKNHLARDHWILERVFSFRNAVRVPQLIDAFGCHLFYQLPSRRSDRTCSIVSAEEATTASRSPSLN
jgi:hypothetical protein